MKKPKKIWDNYRELAEVQKSSKIKFVIAGATRDGIRYINIREFYLRQKDGVWRPGRDGITLPVEMPILVDKDTTDVTTLHPYYDMVHALAEAVQIIKDMALSDEAHAVYAEPKEDTK